MPNQDRPPPYGLRMPSELKEEIRKRAEGAGRSLNSEIVQRLKASLSAEKQPIPNE
ncbi:MAG: Arc family DNA-binding protein [Pseudomonadota bacterium]